jgi:hypothetical protein
MLYLGLIYMYLHQRLKFNLLHLDMELVKPQVATGLLLRLVYQHLSSQKISRLSQHRLKVESDCNLSLTSMEIYMRLWKSFLMKQFEQFVYGAALLVMSSTLNKGEVSHLVYQKHGLN